MLTMLRGELLRLPRAAVIELSKGVEVALLFDAERAPGAGGRRPVGPEGLYGSRRHTIRERGYGRVLIKQLAELYFEAEPLVQRACRLRESEGIESEFDKRNRWIKAFGLQSGQIGEQLTKARNMRS